MKRNLDLIRHILLVTENSENERLSSEDYTTSDFSIDAVTYHLNLLVDEDLIKTQEFHPINSMLPLHFVMRLSSKGHDFLDSIRDDKIFNKTKKKMLEVAGNTTLDLVFSVATQITKSLLNI